MYLHIGGDRTVRAREVIAILEARGRHARAHRALVERAAAQGRLVDLAGGAPGSIVLTDRGVYLSPVSPSALRRRLAEGAVPTAGERTEA